MLKSKGKFNIGLLADKRIPGKHRVLLTMGLLPDPCWVSSLNIAVITGLSADEVRQYQRRLVNEGLLRRVSKGSFTLVNSDLPEESLTMLRLKADPEYENPDLVDKIRRKEVEDFDAKSAMVTWDLVPLPFPSAFAMARACPDAFVPGTQAFKDFWGAVQSKVKRAVVASKSGVPAAIVTAHALFILELEMAPARLPTKYRKGPLAYLIDQVHRKLDTAKLLDEKNRGWGAWLLAFYAGRPSLRSFMRKGDRSIVPPVITGELVLNPSEKQWEGVRVWQAEQLRMMQSPQPGSENAAAEAERTRKAISKSGDVESGGARSPSQEPPQEHKDVSPESNCAPSPGTADPTRVQSPSESTTCGAKEDSPVRELPCSSGQSARAIVAKEVPSQPSPPAREPCRLCCDNRIRVDRLTGDHLICKHGETEDEKIWLERLRTAKNCKLCDGDGYCFDRVLGELVPCDHDRENPNLCNVEEVSDEEFENFAQRLRARNAARPPVIQKLEDDDETTAMMLPLIDLNASAQEDVHDRPEKSEGSHPEDCECKDCLDAMRDVEVDDD